MWMETDGNGLRLGGGGSRRNKPFLSRVCGGGGRGLGREQGNKKEFGRFLVFPLFTSWTLVGSERKPTTQKGSFCISKMEQSLEVGEIGNAATHHGFDVRMGYGVELVVFKLQI
jgi:hypothetical protein